MITKVQKKLRYDVDYKKIDLESIEIDTVVPFNIYVRQDDDYVIIVKAGTIIDKKIYNVLIDKNIYVFKDNYGNEKLKCSNVDKYIISAKDNPEYCVKTLYKVNDMFFEEFSNSKDYSFDIKDVEGIVKSIVFLVQHNSNFVKENMIHFKNDNDLAHHSLHVCLYAVSLGSALGIFTKEELMDLGIAGYIQDFGLKKVDEKLVSKDSSLSKSELVSIHKHTMLSVYIAQHNKVHRPDIIDGVKHHHENYDGSGYPDGLNAKNISKFAAVLAICDVFDALTSKRTYRKEKSSFEALTFMMKDDTMKHRFDHSYIKTFIIKLLNVS